MERERVGVLTGGGDCPGLNAAIRAVVKRGHQLGFEIVGIKDGWSGLLDLTRPSNTDGQTLEPMAIVLSDQDVSGILDKGGTILGSSRTNPSKIEKGFEKIAENWEKLKLFALIVIGGEDTLSVAVELKKRNLNVIGIPKTIDNDVGGTDYCIGFDTAVFTAVEALDKLHSTAEAHHRVMVLEVMGRDCGWIATVCGFASGADYILIPEVSVSVEEVATAISVRYRQGKNFSLIVISEGAAVEGKKIAEEEKDSFGHKKLGGVGEVLADLLKEKTGFETRAINLGHLLRGGAPVPTDRIMASRFGLRAIELIKREKFGQMVVLRGKKIVSIPLEESAKVRRVDLSIYNDAKLFFG